MKWYFKALKNYIGFQGRARRKEFWTFAIFSYLVLVIYGVIKGLMNLPLTGTDSFLGGLYLIAVFLPALAVTIRRLHDTGKNGGWIFSVFIPLIGMLTLLILLCLDGEKGENQYGPNPK
ncbi:DUF805 domain-containing protein [Bacillus sonorensis]|uniref:DUF805 domain-containing protein n=1 Tax=Bacillus sonorensis TaxID=119858 RepID=UPI00098B0FC8|nr:DUF805 domain-containing protein [Bacillus sonorensis]